MHGATPACVVLVQVERLGPWHNFAVRGEGGPLRLKDTGRGLIVGHLKKQLQGRSSRGRAADPIFSFYRNFRLGCTGPHLRVWCWFRWSAIFFCGGWRWLGWVCWLFRGSVGPWTPPEVLGVGVSWCDCSSTEGYWVWGLGSQMDGCMPGWLVQGGVVWTGPGVGTPR